MKPWFIKEAEIIKFPEPVKNVVELPNVQSYPDFQDRMQILRTIPFVYNECTDVVFEMKAEVGPNTVSVFGEGILVDYSKDR